jgi:hypothetical protein
MERLVEGPCDDDADRRPGTYARSMRNVCGSEAKTPAATKSRTPPMMSGVVLENESTVNDSCAL